MADNDNQSKPAGKTMQDRAKEIGRDGAYVEVDACNLITAAKNSEFDKAKIAVITFGRIELSDHEQIAQLKSILEIVMARECKGGPGNGELDDDQASFLALRRKFEKGLKVLSENPV